MSDIKLVVSPMAGVTDAPFRQLCLSNGADYAVSEMITSQVDLWSSAKTQTRMKSTDLEKIKIIQIAGASPEIIRKAIITAEDCFKPDVIEINMGCPAKKVCNVLAGSALLKDEKLVEAILDASVNATKIPIYLKTRLGWSSENKNILTIAEIAEKAGVKSLTIHGRTREDMYNGEANYDLIKKVKTILSIPVFANGDIITPEKASQVINETGVDGIYIGRGALGQPWLFKQIKDYFKTGYYQKFSDPIQFKNLILNHINEIHNHYDGLNKIRFARKHFKWYLTLNESFFSASALEIFTLFVQIESTELQLEFISNLF